jgi:chaperonin GroES
VVLTPSDRIPHVPDPHTPEEVSAMSASATKSAKKKPHLIPLGDRVVVEREESGQKTAGGILLPDSAKDKPARGVVVSVGEGKLTDKGTRQPLQVKPGDRVVFTSYAGEPFKVGDSELLLMREDDILAVLP